MKWWVCQFWKPQFYYIVFNLLSVQSKAFTSHSAPPQLLDSDYDENYVSSDDGIDVGSPLFSPLNTNRPFQYPINDKSFAPIRSDPWQNIPNTSPKTIVGPQSPQSYASSVDNHFEFGASRFDCFSPEKTYDFFQRFRKELWTDIDELDWAAEFFSYILKVHLLLFKFQSWCLCYYFVCLALIKHDWGEPCF